MNRIVSAAIAFVILITAAAFSAFAEGSDRSDFVLGLTVDGIDVARTGATLIVYENGEAFKSGVDNTGLGIAVDASGTVAAVSSSASLELPAGGYIVSGGQTYKRRLSAVKEGDLVRFDRDNMLVTIISPNYDPFVRTTLKFNGFNLTRTADTLIIYRDRASTNTNVWGYEAVVDENGVIVSVGGNNNAVPNGGFVLSAVGAMKQPLTDAAQIGMAVEIDTESKTVLIGYSAESAVKRYALEISRLEEKYQELYCGLYDFDLFSADCEVFKQAVSELRDAADASCKAIDSNDILAFASYDCIFNMKAAKTASGLIPAAAAETRGIWLRIPTSPSDTSVTSTVEMIASLGFNSVYIEAMFDNTLIFPAPEGSPFEQNPAFGGKDMLKAYIDEFHSKNIEVHLWMSCLRVGYEGSSNTVRSVGSKKPEWRCVSQTGSTVVSNEYGDAYFLNPALPEVRKLLLDTYEYLLDNYGFDGFQLDYVRYPEASGQIYGYDDTTKKLFLESHDYTAVPVTSGQAGWSDWVEFRASFVTEIVRSLRELIDKKRPDVLLSADVAPASLDGVTGTMCQDAVFWTENRLIDILYPMAYGTTDAVAKWTERTLAICGDEVYSVIGLRDNGSEVYGEQIAACRELGAAGTAFFSYSQYIAGDYVGVIEKTLFASGTVNPTANSREALIAILNAQAAKLKEYDAMRRHIVDTDPAFIAMDLELSPDENASAALKSIETELSALENSKVSERTDGLSALVLALRGFAANARESEPLPGDTMRRLNDGLCRSLESAARSVSLAVTLNKDDERELYRSAHPDTSDQPESADISESASVTEESEPAKDVGTVNKIFQVFFIAVMTIGVLGLPLYWYLDKRRRRIAEEYKGQGKRPEPDDPTGDDVSEDAGNGEE